MEPKWEPWGQNGSQKGAKKAPERRPKPRTPKSHQNEAKMAPKRHQNGGKMAPKWYQNGAQIGSGGQLEGKLFAGSLADPLAGTSSSTLSHRTFFKGRRAVVAMPLGYIQMFTDFVSIWDQFFIDVWSMLESFWSTCSVRFQSRCLEAFWIDVGSSLAQFLDSFLRAL